MWLALTVNAPPGEADTVPGLVVPSPQSIEALKLLAITDPPGSTNVATFRRLDAPSIEITPLTELTTGGGSETVIADWNEVRKHRRRL